MIIRYFRIYLFTDHIVIQHYFIPYKFDVNDRYFSEFLSAFYFYIYSVEIIIIILVILKVELKVVQLTVYCHGQHPLKTQQCQTVQFLMPLRLQSPII